MAQDIFKPYRIAYNELATYDKEKGNIFFITDRKLIYLDLDSEQRIQLIPTNTSDLNNDNNFITRAVDNLANYYSKDEIDYLATWLGVNINSKISFDNIYDLFNSIQYGGHESSASNLPDIIDASRRSATPTATDIYTISNLKANINELNDLKNSTSNSNIRNKWIRDKKQEMLQSIFCDSQGEILDLPYWISSAYVDNSIDNSIKWEITFLTDKNNRVIKTFLCKAKTNYGVDVTIPVYLLPAGDYAQVLVDGYGWTAVTEDGVSALYKQDVSEKYKMIYNEDESLYIYPDVYSAEIDPTGISFLEYDDSWSQYCPGTTICGNGGKFTLYKDVNINSTVRSYIESNSDYIFEKWYNQLALPEFDGYDGEETCVIKNGGVIKLDATGYMTYNFLSPEIGEYNLLFTIGNNNDLYYLSKDTLQYEQWNKLSSTSIISALGYTPADAADLGQANGIATLDNSGKIPSTQLPSYVDDVIEGYYNTTDGKFYEESTYTTEIIGEDGKIYVDLTTNKTYRWSGSTFVVIASDLALGETHSSAYYGDYGKVAYDHATAKGSAFASNLYKITTNAEGHVTAASAMTQADFNTDYDIKPTAIVTVSKNNVSDKSSTEIQTLVANGYNVVCKWENSTNRYIYLPLSTSSPYVSFTGVLGNGHPNTSATIYRTITLQLSGTSVSKTYKAHKDNYVGLKINYDTESPSVFSIDGLDNLGNTITQWVEIYTLAIGSNIYLRYSHTDYSTGDSEDFIIPLEKCTLTTDVETGNQVFAFKFATIGNLGLPGDVAGEVYYYKFYIDSTSTGSTYITGNSGTITKIRVDGSGGGGESGVIPVDPDDTTDINIWIETE